MPVCPSVETWMFRRDSLAIGFLCRVAALVWMPNTHIPTYGAPVSNWDWRGMQYSRNMRFTYLVLPPQ
eukprot:1543688-Amphidinium_carterae.2